LDTGVLPKDWRDANISSIFKKGDKHLPENYRPVSLTSVTCKILEHLIWHSFSIRFGILSGPDAFDGFIFANSFSRLF
jgi:hypothetical protein